MSIPPQGHLLLSAILNHNVRQATDDLQNWTANRVLDDITSAELDVMPFLAFRWESDRQIELDARIEGVRKRVFLAWSRYNAHFTDMAEILRAAHFDFLEIGMLKLSQCLISASMPALIPKTTDIWIRGAEVGRIVSTFVDHQWSYQYCTRTCAVLLKAQEPPVRLFWRLSRHWDTSMHADLWDQFQNANKCPVNAVVSMLQMPQDPVVDFPKLVGLAHLIGQMGEVGISEFTKICQKFILQDDLQNLFKSLAPFDFPHFKAPVSADHHRQALDEKLQKWIDTKSVIRKFQYLFSRFQALRKISPESYNNYFAYLTKQRAENRKILEWIHSLPDPIAK